MSSLELSEPSYHLLLDGRKCAQIIRQPDGEYVTPVDDIPLEWDATQSLAELRDANGMLAESMVLTVRDPSSGMKIYQLPNGTAVDEPTKDALRLGAPYVFVMPRRCVLRPQAQAQQVAVGANTDVGVWHVPALSTDMDVAVNDRVVWQPCLVDGPQQPAWAGQVHVGRAEPHDHCLGGQVTFTVRLPTGAYLRYAAIDLQPLDFSEPEFERVQIGPLELTAAIVSGRPTLLLCVQREMDTLVIREHVELRASGLVRRDGSTWTAVDPTDPLLAEAAAREVYRVLVHDESKQWCLREGGTPIGRVVHRSTQLTGLNGYGANLVMAQDGFNPIEEPRELAQGVESRGTQLRRAILAEPGPGPALLQLELYHRLEPSGAHRCLCWLVDGRYRFYSGDEIVSDDGWHTWKIDLSELDAEVAAVGLLGAAGTRLGGQGFTTWPQALQNSTSCDVASGAALLRWLHLPVLDDRYRSVVRTFLRRHPAVVLQTWLADESPIPGLPFDLEEEARNWAWHAAVRRLMWKWRPQPGQAQSILQALARDAETVPSQVAAVISQLSECDPLSTARWFRSWLEESPAIKIGDDATELIKAVCCELFGMAAFDRQRMVAIVEASLQPCCREMRLSADGEAFL
ncbi:MAG: hypothetical protein GX600_10075, partial [Dehalococcoidia bacterium]|nr:hypothetical protein [Dehalococcoidia bacterium]